MKAQKRLVLALLATVLLCSGCALSSSGEPVVEATPMPTAAVTPMPSDSPAPSPTYNPFYDTEHGIRDTMYTPIEEYPKIDMDNKEIASGSGPYMRTEEGGWSQILFMNGIPDESDYLITPQRAAQLGLAAGEAWYEASGYECDLMVFLVQEAYVGKDHFYHVWLKEDHEEYLVTAGGALVNVDTGEVWIIRGPNPPLWILEIPQPENVPDDMKWYAPIRVPAESDSPNVAEITED